MYFYILRKKCQKAVISVTAKLLRRHAGEYDRMSKFMHPETALARTVEDERAPIRLRVQALTELQHPSLNLLRRLLVEHNGTSKASQRSKRTKPAPAKLKALAAIRFAQEWRFPELRLSRKRDPQKFTNPLGI